MKIISALHQHPLHHVAHDEPYLKRYHNGLSLLDHYRQLYQLQFVYEAIEEKMGVTNFKYQLPDELQYLLKRSDEIKKDLAYLRPLIAPQDKSVKQLDETKKYVKLINGLDDHDALFIHYLVRVLGDLFGGAGLAKCVSTLCDQNKYGSQEATHFYTFPSDAMKAFTHYLNQQTWTESAVREAATIAFQGNIDILKALENDRAANVCSLSQPGTFFQQHKRDIIFGGIMAVGITGLALNQYLKSYTK